MTTLSILLSIFAAGFVSGIAWYWFHARESRRTRYRVPAHVVTVAAVRCPRPGACCHNWHGLVPPGGRCKVCGERVVRTVG